MINAYHSNILKFKIWISCIDRGKSKYELSDIVKRFDKSFADKQTLSPQQTKALLNIARCRTSVIGGYKAVCDCCV